MTHNLKISEGLSLPIEAVTQTFAVLAKRGSGKSYCASVMAEEMLKAKQQVVYLDPTGGAWGLRSGFPIVVMGGEHGDITLEQTAGEVIAQAIVENRFSAVIDLSLFRKGQMIQFMVNFSETLYRLNREPVHLFVDEADAFAPQGRNWGGDENRMLGAMEDIVRRGRKRGIGCTLITQRPAVLNKNVLTQCESLFVLRMVHPKDIDAIKEWIDVHTEPKEAGPVIDSLPSLPIGEAWFWSPGWMDILKRIKIRQRETFDSSATPKPGERPKVPQSLAEIDLGQLGEKIKATVQRAMENDPKELRKQIAELQKQIRTVKPKEIIDEVAVQEAHQSGQASGRREIIEKVSKQLLDFTGSLQSLNGRIMDLANSLVITTGPAPKTLKAEHEKMSAYSRRESHKLGMHVTRDATPLHNAGSRSSGSSNGHLPIGEQKTLTALIQYPDGLRREQLTVLTGYKRSSRDAYIARLKEKGFVESNGERVLATGQGVSALPNAEPLPTGEALQEYWLARLPLGERTVLECLIAAYPKSISRTDIDDATEYKRSSRDAYLARLSAKELVSDAGPGMIKASDELFG